MYSIVLRFSPKIKVLSKVVQNYKNLDIEIFPYDAILHEFKSFCQDCNWTDLISYRVVGQFLTLCNDFKPGKCNVDDDIY